MTTDDALAEEHAIDTQAKADRAAAVAQYREGYKAAIAAGLHGAPLVALWRECVETVAAINAAARQARLLLAPFLPKTPPPAPGTFTAT